VAGSKPRERQPLSRTDSQRKRHPPLVTRGLDGSQQGRSTQPSRWSKACRGRPLRACVRAESLGYFFTNKPGCPISHDRFLVGRCGKYADLPGKTLPDPRKLRKDIRLFPSSPLKRRAEIWGTSVRWHGTLLEMGNSISSRISPCPQGRLICGRDHRNR
jgi:hypothetical protein